MHSTNYQSPCPPSRIDDASSDTQNTHTHTSMKNVCTWKLHCHIPQLEVIQTYAAGPVGLLRQVVRGNLARTASSFPDRCIKFHPTMPGRGMTGRGASARRAKHANQDLNKSICHVQLEHSFRQQAQYVLQQMTKRSWSGSKVFRVDSRLGQFSAMRAIDTSDTAGHRGNIWRTWGENYSHERTIHQNVVTPRGISRCKDCGIEK